MAAKDIKEKVAFGKAKEVREILLNRLNACKTHQDLEKTLNDYKAKKKKHFFDYPELTAYHAAVIQGLNLNIENITAAKSATFNLAVQHLNLHAEVEEAAAEVEEAAAEVEDATAEVEDAVYEAGYVSAETKASPKVMAVEKRVVVAAPKPLCDKNVSYDKLSGNYPPVNLDKTRHLEAVRTQMALLVKKAEYFLKQHKQTNDSKYSKANVAAMALHKAVDKLTKQYEFDKIDLSTYKSQARELFDKNNEYVKELGNHRGCKEFLVNLLAAVLGNVVFFAAAAFAGTLRLFKPATDSAKKVTALSNAIEAVEEDAQDLNSYSYYN